jgi:hypothetical protein
LCAASVSGACFRLPYIVKTKSRTAKLSAPIPDRRPRAHAAGRLPSCGDQPVRPSLPTSTQSAPFEFRTPGLPGPSYESRCLGPSVKGATLA